MTAPTIKFEVKGVQEQIKALGAIDKRYQRAALKAALEQAGKVLLARTVELAPDETGTLKESLDMQVKVKRGRGEVRVGPKKLIRLVIPGQFGRALKSDTSTPQYRSPSFEAPEDIDHRGYEVFQEFGSEHHQAQSFIRRALDEKKDEALYAASRMLERALKADVE